MKTTSLVVFLSLCYASSARAQTLEWTRQLGTNEGDSSSGVSADGLGNVYMSGTTENSLGGPFAGGFYDAFISKYDASGTLEWTRQLGTSSADRSTGVSADGLGNVYMSGYTGGSLGGPFVGGTADAFLAKYNESVGLPPDEIYSVVDDNSDAVFDDLGDYAADASSASRGSVGEVDTASRNQMVRRVAKYVLPEATEDKPVLESATLGFFLEAIEGTPAGPVSFFIV